MSEPHQVLIVEDDLDLQHLLTFTFESGGFETVCRADGADALEYLESREELPDLILLDLLMPDVDGIGFLRRRAEDERLAEIPTIVLTGIDNEDTVADAFELGADDYVTKPFSPKALLTRGKRLL